MEFTTLAPIFLFLQGLILGFSIAAPVGPIGVLCIRRTLADGQAAGFVSGLGAATADAIYGSVAVFGLSGLSAILVGQQAVLRLAGGLFLVYLGARTFLSRPAQAGASAAGSQRRGLTGAYLSTLFLTLTNPITILAFAAIFAGLGVGAALPSTTTQSTALPFGALASTGNLSDAEYSGVEGALSGPSTTLSAPASGPVVVLGVFAGSALWWLILSAGSNWLRERFLQPGALVWINRLSGLVIAGFGLAVLASLWRN